MRRKKIPLPPKKEVIEGDIEYIQNEETSYYDKYNIKINGVIQAYIYVHKSSFLLPDKITFKREIEVINDY